MIAAEEDYQDVSFVCHVDGHRRVEHFEDVCTSFAEADFAWVKLTDFFRSGFGKGANEGYVGKVAKEVGRRFGYALLTHGSLPLRIDDSVLLDEHGDSPGRNLLACWATKFGRLFKGEKPYEFSTLLVEGDVPAYRMKPGKHWIIVEGIDPDCGVDPVGFHWEVFQSLAGVRKAGK